MTYRLSRRIAVVLVVTALAACAAADDAGRVIKYWAVPQTADDFARVFGHAPSPGQLDDVVRAGDESLSAGAAVIGRSVQRTVRDQFLDDLGRTENAVISLTGHSQGGVFYFNDGSTEQLRVLAEQSGSNILAFIACDSAKFTSGQAAGIPTALTVSVAVRTQQIFDQRIARLVTDGTTITADLAQAHMESAFDDAKRALNVGLAIKYSLLATPAVGISIYEVVSDS